MVKFWTPALLLATVLATAKTTSQSLVGSVISQQQNPSTLDAGLDAGVVHPLQDGAVTGSESVAVDQSLVTTTTETATADGATGTTGNAPAAPTGKGTNPLVIEGYRFFDNYTGEYFGMRGVNYYPRPNKGALDSNNLDLFTNANKHIWGRDLPHFVALNANSIRLYAVDPDGDHTDFMCALQSAGIYVIVDLGSSCKGCEITTDQAPACYPASYKQRGEKIIQNFAKYDNVIGFSGGNEVNHRTGGHTPDWNAPCQKKFVRDMRAYIQSCKTMRKIPVGLVVADSFRDDNAQYYNCRTDPEDSLENAEWYGINTYVHCSNSEDPAVGSGFDQLKKSFESYKYSIPTIITEFGCTSEGFPTVEGFGGQRTFHDAKWMNEEPYSDYFNGGFVFEYSTEYANSQSTSAYPFTKAGPQNYGLGYFTPENCNDGDTPCNYVRFPNFNSLAKAYSIPVKIKDTLSSFKADKTRNQPTQCPATWPKLKDLTWPSDKAASEACPQITHYQCPYVPLRQAVITHAETANASSSSSTTASSSMQESGASPSDPIPDADTNEAAATTQTAAGSMLASMSLTALLASAVMVYMLQ